MRTRIVITTLLLAACARDSGPAPSTIVERFYAAKIATGSSGAPSAETLEKLRPYLSDTVTALLKAARARHDTDVVRAPDEKPAFAEGDLFSSLFEGATEVKVLADSAEGTTHRVTLGMTYGGGTPPVEWTDVVILVPEHGRFVIDDVRYGGTWDFANTGSLRQGLVAALAQP